jgi:hypothetical protein
MDELDCIFRTTVGMVATPVRPFLPVLKCPLYPGIAEISRLNQLLIDSY